MTRPHIAYTDLSEFTIVTQPDGALHIEIAPGAIPDFTKLVRRGSNTWDAAPVAVKQLVDILTVGHIQQNYAAQAPKK